MDQCFAPSTATRNERGRLRGHSMMKGECMATQSKPATQSVTWRVFRGLRAEVQAQVDAAEYPEAWGPVDMVKTFIMQWVPIGTGWRGEIRVTGYRTPLNDNGTGTAYLSVHWDPRKG